MSKVLSVIIPTYNMEAFLPRCLDSLLADDALESLEVIVVNDGSKDGSLNIARNYAYRFPTTVTVIDKPNGNYGSTINSALPVAKGRYVKVLDADDYFDTKALLQFLSALSGIDADLAVTHFTQLGSCGAKEVFKYNTMGKEPYEYGKVYEADDVLKDGYIRFFLMHAIAYRTDLLRSIGYHQSEGISYTDTELAFLPIFHISSLVFLDINLYQYNLDREGQTMNPTVLARSASQLEKVTDRLLEYYESHIATVSEVRRAFMKQYIENRLRVMCKLHLLDMPRNSFNSEAFGDMFDKYMQACTRDGLSFKLYPENKLLRIDYVAYWQKHRHRWPAALEKFNAILDKVVKWAYVKVFRG